MNDTTLDLAALREIAEVATPGTRLMVHDEQIVVLENGVIIYDRSCEGRGDWEADNDAPFIAAFDQPTALALIAELEVAEAKIAEVRELHKPFEVEEYYNGMGGESLSRVGYECAGCADAGGIKRYPCPTIAALGGTNA